MLRDAEYFKMKMGILDERNDAGDFLVQLIKGKFVPKTTAASAQPSNAADEGETTADSANDQTPQESGSLEDKKGTPKTP